uniref:ADP-ribose diphosphatase n=1 Tax=Thaumasiovibrio occultus TaxID=1891184 RepID=UPI000B34EB97|nr:ADP-ribose diphosphatase [Thaumasiovibrio occultus]
MTRLQFGQQDVEVLEQTTEYDGFFKMVKYRLRHKLFAGGWSGEMDRLLFERGTAVALLPYDPIRDEVVLVEQFRIGAHVAGCAPWQLELVAGMVEEGESAEDVALREAQEEAGLAVSTTEFVTRYLSSSGGCSETLAVLAGQVDSSVAGGLHGLAEEHEDIRVHVVSRAQAYEWVVSGKIENAASIIALQWLQLNYSRLQAQWNGD